MGEEGTSGASSVDVVCVRRTIHAVAEVSPFPVSWMVRLTRTKPD